VGYIHCCGGKRKSVSYTISPQDNYIFVEMDFLEKCPVCGHAVLQITKLNINNEISVCRKTNKKALKLFDKLKNFIISKGKYSNKTVKGGSTFYLGYNEFGIKKRCYSNLSTLKMGKFENTDFCEMQKLHI
jgi:hypothetical protein